MCWSQASDLLLCACLRRGHEGRETALTAKMGVHVVCWFVFSFLNEIRVQNGKKKKKKSAHTTWSPSCPVRHVQPSVSFAEGTSKQADRWWGCNISSLACWPKRFLLHAQLQELKAWVTGGFPQWVPLLWMLSLWGTVATFFPHCCRVFFFFFLVSIELSCGFTNHFLKVDNADPILLSGEPCSTIAPRCKPRDCSWPPPFLLSSLYYGHSCERPSLYCFLFFLHVHARLTLVSSALPRHCLEKCQGSVPSGQIPKGCA